MSAGFGARCATRLEPHLVVGSGVNCDAREAEGISWHRGNGVYTVEGARVLTHQARETGGVPALVVGDRQGEPLETLPTLTPRERLNSCVQRVRFGRGAHGPRTMAQGFATRQDDSSGDGLGDDRLRLFLNLPQVLHADKTLGVDLVLGLGARGACREPTVFGDDLEPPDAFSVARRIGENGLDGFT